MKKFLVIISASIFAFGLVSCGGKKAGDEKTEEESVNTSTNPLDALTNMAKDAENGNDAAQAKLKERRAKGDTLAMPYAELIKYLPTSVNGYKAGEPDGSSINMPGASYSTANITFTKDNGDNIKVTLMDYNAAYGMYSSMTGMWALGMSVDSPDEKAEGVKFDGNIGGWEDYHKKSHDASITLGVGYRFWVSVEGTNQDGIDFVKSVAKTMDLKKLDNL
jgi:ABC-type glycerol-3-phosphate transport system substrate-binding protein